MVSRGFRIRHGDGNFTREGEWAYYFPNGQVREQGSYTDDKKSGKWTSYDLDDYGEYSLSHRERYDENGVAEYRWVYANGPSVVSAEGPLQSDTKQGKWTAYNGAGKKKSDSIYEADEVVGWTMFDETGGVFATFVNGVYTLQGVVQDKKTIPRYVDRRSPTGNASDAEYAWHHAFKKWPQP